MSDPATSPAPEFSIEPVGHRILVQPVQFAYTGKVYLDATVSQDAPDRGKVIACGPQVGVDDLTNERWLALEPGDVVLWGKFSGIPLAEDRHLVRDADILAKIHGAVLKEFDATGQVVQSPV